MEHVEQTDLDRKRDAYTFGTILQCWKHHSSLDAILDYDAYVDDGIRQAVDR